MPCFGSRKKNKRKNVPLETAAAQPSPTPQPAQQPEEKQPQQQLHPPVTSNRPPSIASSVVQIRQEYKELKTKQTEHLDVIARQSAELEELRSLVSNHKSGADLDLQQKELKLQQREKEIEELMQKIQAQEQQQDEEQLQLAEQLKAKDKQLEELQAKWKQEAAVKPALQQVTDQLEDLKKANDAAVSRLAETEKELTTLRSQQNPPDGSPKDSSKDQERQKRLNRLTMDLESDKFMIQKLEELNQQLEAQKKKHEATLQTHAEEMAEKDRVLVQHQQSLSELKADQERAIKNLERKQTETLNELQNKHERDTKILKERLENVERRAKSDMNSEVEKLLQEFEQSEHAHSVQMASLQKSHQKEMSVMKQGQKAELQNHIKRASMVLLEKNSEPINLRKTGGSASARVMRWPVAVMKQQEIELVPRDSSHVQIYVSSVSANPTIKRNQESLQTMLTSKQITFQVVDVAQSEPALQHMRRQNVGNTRNLPQVFVGGEYRGPYDEVMRAVESGTLSEFLRPREKDIKLSVATRKLPRKGSQPSSGSLSSNEPTTPTTLAPAVPPVRIAQQQRINNATHDEDADLLKEIEKELAQSDFSKVDLNF
ncbi:SH3-binding, glutamic acid-rich protein-domain-containing protein [Zychaea mexicana]|uniref:SH3-binding, glutamic acid-rich protein-domain-containing protein n=1 Tax=Zychaea mexicana TaxID=64656 RepID=UPI0022FDF06A|nr:SH3-binding, glutamic acid-rich protein-domain-containing protein [Zychaea mexicana]KAI9499337.1 SH3-binding, glutamic acid-rich protein-domain-containing protein [Zychaea mexicana]